MILNPTHEITLSGLPSDILDAYVRYKKGTRAIVSWIVQYGPSRYSRVKTLPLKELAALAASLKGVLKELPDVIHFHFRETIAARKRLSKYFRGNIDGRPDAADTVNHEHFTTSLSQVYSDLCACCDKPRLNCAASNERRAESSTSKSLTNHYQNLLVEEIFEEESRSLDVSQSSCSQCLAEAPPSCSAIADGNGLVLADDELGNAIELATLLQACLPPGQQFHSTYVKQGVCSIFDSIEQSWARAGKAEIHFAAAAFTTNLALADLMQLENRMRELDEDASLRRLRQRCCTLTWDDHSLSGKPPAWHDLLEQLSETQQAYEHYTHGHKLSLPSISHTCVQMPFEYVHSTDETSCKTRSTLLKTLVSNVVHLIGSKSTPCAIVRNSSPAYADLGYALTTSNKSTNDMRLLFGFHLLRTSYCQYLDNSIPAKLSSCRLASLKLAQQALKSVGTTIKDETCFPCRCSQTLAFHLQNLETDLTSFAKFRCWDLYFQSPWVAGNHILEMLDLCHYYGMKLFRYRHYVAAVVHSYNVLHQISGLEEIPLLEYVCEEFKETLFPGGHRPTSNFRGSWTRCIGARLKFTKGHKSKNHRDSWCMAVPAHAARKAAGLSVCGDSKEDRSECLLFKIKQQDYHVTDRQVENLAEDSLSNDFGNMHINGTASAETTSPASQRRLTQLLPKINTFLTSDSTNPSSALLDHFAVFNSCVRIIASISDATHTEEKAQGMNCICFASAILGGADRIMEARKLGRTEGASWRKQEREGVLDLVTKYVRGEMGGKQVREWCWEI